MNKSTETRQEPARRSENTKVVAPRSWKDTNNRRYKGILAQEQRKEWIDNMLSWF